MFVPAGRAVADSHNAGYGISAFEAKADRLVANGAHFEGVDLLADVRLE
jgi:fatty acid-binding protein DegV